MLREIFLEDHLVIPFGRPKWEIENIKIKQVTPKGTYLASRTPLAYIEKNKERAIQIADFWDVIPDEFSNSFKKISPHFDRDKYDYNYISQEASSEFQRRFKIIRNYLKNRCELGSIYEKKFLDLYFDFWEDKAWEDGPCDHSLQEQLRPLLPLPQAHLYLEDSLECKTHMQKVDFAFWTGRKIIAIEIDSDTKLLPDVVRRDRRYRDSGIEVIHILNSEIEEFMSSVIDILPYELKDYDFVRQLPRRSFYISDVDDDSNYL